MKPSLSLLPLTAALLLANEFVVSSFASSPPPIPMNQLGAVAGKQYQGDGLSVRGTATGAELRCAFQRLEGEVTAEGLWLRSTAVEAEGERFRLLATGVGRDRECAAGSCCGSADWQSAVSRIGNPQAAPGWSVQPTASRQHSRLPTCATAERPVAMPAMGRVETSENVTRFIRPGLTEEYSVSVDGVRQDFLIAQPPVGTGELRLELDVTGATVAQLGNGVRLTLSGSGRQLAYHRLHVTDATGRELPAQMEVAAEMPAATRLAVLVDDANAVFPVRIDPTFSDEDWVSLSAISGTDGGLTDGVDDAVVDASGNLYIGGNFIFAGSAKVNRIAKWDGNTWSALGTGMDLNVWTVKWHSNDLYAGGIFTNAGGVLVNRIAKWNGVSWSALGAGIDDGGVMAMAFVGTDLYVGGGFTSAGGVMANRIAKWDGTGWSALGAGANGAVWALASHGGELYAAGSFTTMGGIAANRIARWNGVSWSALGVGLNNTVNALAVQDGSLYVGGSFTSAGGSPANSIARWNGSIWFALGSGMDGGVYSLATSGGNVYAAGGFTTAGGNSANSIAKWNGNTWTPLGLGAFGAVNALAAHGDNLYAGGLFSMAGGAGANKIAKWNGDSWSNMGPGINGAVFAAAVLGTDFYIGGSFTTAGGVNANRVARWDGNTWSALGTGMNSNVLALAASGTNLYAGGRIYYRWRSECKSVGQMGRKRMDLTRDRG
jgi:hypothetical protein